jgi:hypothetical protein
MSASSSPTPCSNSTVGTTSIVGTALNVINQGDALLVGAPVDVLKTVLTYMVLYCVATLGAVSSRLDLFNTAQK